MLYYTSKSSDLIPRHSVSVAGYDCMLCLKLLKNVLSSTITLVTMKCYCLN